MWHLNVRGWKSKAAELTALIRLEEEKPAVVCITETFLDRSTGEVCLEGYELAARRDRSDDSGWGGALAAGLRQL